MWRPDIVDARNRIEDVSKRLDGLREWVRQSSGSIIELAPGYTAWLRDRDAAIEKWEAAEADPDLREQCALLADAGMKAEIDRLKDPAAEWRARAADDRQQAALPESRAAAAPSDGAARTQAAESADRILPDPGQDLRDRARDADRSRDLVLELARAFAAPVTSARAAADAAIAEAEAAGDPQDPLKDARLRSEAWGRACDLLDRARTAYEENGSPVPAAEMGKEAGAARERQDFQDARIAALKAESRMTWWVRRLDRLEEEPPSLSSRHELDMFSTDLHVARDVCREMVAAKETLEESGSTGDANERARLADRAQQAQDVSRNLDRQLRHVDAALGAVALFEQQKQNPQPDWKETAARLREARQDGVPVADVFARAACALAQACLEEAEPLRRNQEEEERLRQQQQEARQREQEQTRRLQQEALARQQAEEERLSREEQKSEGWSMSR